MSDFEAIIMPNTSQKIRSSVIPNNRVCMEQWFYSYNVSTYVKKLNIVDRHVFDVDVFKKNKKHKLLILLKKLLKFI